MSLFDPGVYERPIKYLKSILKVSYNRNNPNYVFQNVLDENLTGINDVVVNGLPIFIHTPGQPYYVGVWRSRITFRLADRFNISNPYFNFKLAYLTASGSNYSFSNWSDINLIRSFVNNYFVYTGSIFYDVPSLTPQDSFSPLFPPNVKYYIYQPDPFNQSDQPFFPTEGAPGDLGLPDGRYFVPNPVGTGKRALTTSIFGILGRESNQVGLSILCSEKVTTSVPFFLANKIQPTGILKEKTPRVGNVKSLSAQIAPGLDKHAANSVPVRMNGSVNKEMYKALNLSTSPKDWKQGSMRFVLNGYEPQVIKNLLTSQLGFSKPAEDWRSSMPGKIAPAYDIRRGKSTTCFIRGTTPGFDIADATELMLRNYPIETKNFPLVISGLGKESKNLPLVITGGNSKHLPFFINGFEKISGRMSLFILGRGDNHFNSVELSIINSISTNNNIDLSIIGEANPITITSILGQGAPKTNLFLKTVESHYFSNSVRLFTLNYNKLNFQTNLSILGDSKVNFSNLVNMAVKEGNSKHLPMFLTGIPNLPGVIGLYTEGSFPFNLLSEYVDLVIVGTGANLVSASNLYINVKNMDRQLDFINLYLTSYNETINKILPIFVKTNEFKGNLFGQMPFYMERNPSEKIEMFIKNEMALSEMLTMLINSSVSTQSSVPLLIPNTLALQNKPANLYTHGFFYRD